MNILSLDREQTSSGLEKDVLAAFNQHSKDITTIQHGMSVKEISEVVSNKVLAVVNMQFEATKKKFHSSRQD